MTIRTEIAEYLQKHDIQIEKQEILSGLVPHNIYAQDNNISLDTDPDNARKLQTDVIFGFAGVTRLNLATDYKSKELRSITDLPSSKDVKANKFSKLDSKQITRYND